MTDVVSINPIEAEQEKGNTNELKSDIGTYQKICPKEIK